MPTCLCSCIASNWRAQIWKSRNGNLWYGHKARGIWLEQCCELTDSVFPQELLDAEKEERRKQREEKAARKAKQEALKRAQEEAAAGNGENGAATEVAANASEAPPDNAAEK